MLKALLMRDASTHEYPKPILLAFIGFLRGLVFGLARSFDGVFPPATRHVFGKNLANFLSLHPFLLVPLRPLFAFQGEAPTIERFSFQCSGDGIQQDRLANRKRAGIYDFVQGPREVFGCRNAVKIFAQKVIYCSGQRRPRLRFGIIHC
ncbi:MAG: hypothetical protein A3E77_09215 [Sphingopyxis sp. RIFCSPHIGHO2_12_FULL_65_19]|nr:MAG: hypothetical protein A3E77_09215 [Sphingopyxis sp. RIFCSPHIGHO2_12_FULL_65_19]